MKRGISVLIAASCLAEAATAATPQWSQKAFAPAVAKYLQTQGDFCLGKFDWPINVSAADRLVQRLERRWPV